MKKLTLILLILSGLLLLTSCESIKYFNRVSKVYTDLKEDLKSPDIIEDTKKPGNVAHKESFEPVPIEMFLLRENEYDNFDKYADNYYYCYGLVPEWTDLKGLDEYMDFFLIIDYDNNVEYLSVAVFGNDEQEGWSDLKEEFEVYVYFKFVGYSHELNRAVGLFEFYELI